MYYMMSSTTDVGPVEAVCCSGVHYVWDVEGATRLRLLHHVMPSAVGFAKPATFARHTRAWTPEEIAAARAKARGVRQLSPRARKARKLRLKAERRAAWAGKSVGASADAAAAPLTSPTTSPALPLVGVSSPCLVMPEAVYVGLQEGWLRVAPHMEAPDVAAASTHGVDRTRAACPMCPPPSERQFQRMLVFHDLWKKGYMVTTGIKFGGDFLAYAGVCVCVVCVLGCCLLLLASVGVWCVRACVQGLMSTAWSALVR